MKGPDAVFLLGSKLRSLVLVAAGLLWSKLGFRRKRYLPALATLVLVGILVVFGVIACAVFLNAQRTLQTRSAVAEAHRKARELQVLLTGVQTAETGQRGFLLTGNAEYLDAYRTGMAEVTTGTAFSKNSSLPQWERMHDVIARKMAELKMTVDLQRKGGHIQAVEVVQSNQGLLLTREMKTIAAKQLKILQANADQASAQNRYAVQELRIMVVWLSMMAALLIALAVYLTWQQYETSSSEAKAMLENEIRLEQRVTERTKALTKEVKRRTRAERKLVKVQSRLDSAAILSGVVTWTWEMADGTLLWYGPVEKVLGMSADKLKQREDFLNRIYPDDRGRIKRLIEKALTEGTEYESEFRFMLPDGGIRWIAARGGVDFENSRPVRMSGVNFDITASKEAELEMQANREILQERERQIDLVFQGLAVGNWRWDLAADCLTAHPIVWQQYGSPPLNEGAPASWFQSRQHHEDWPTIENALETALKGDGKIDTEFRVIWPDGSVHWLACRGSVIRDERGNPIETCGMNFDITERKQMEMQLRESELQFRHLANAIPQIAWVAHSNGSVYFYNERWYEITGSSRGMEGNASWEPIVHPDDLHSCLTTWSDSVQSGVPFELEIRFWDIQRKQYRWYLGRALPVRDEAGKVLRWFGTSTDIHEQKLAKESLEQQVLARTEDLRRALLQKDILFKEVHHRVKNNLQVISSLLRMQADTVEGTAAKALKESHDRVFSMALIHERLYGNQQLDRLDFVNYARTLVDELVFSYARSGSIILNLQAPTQVFVEVDQAIPCGLILNELVTNALKHAYPQGQGEIRITLLETARSEITLAVGDSGVGLPPGFKAAESKSLGISIVTILAKQLGGKLSIQSERGTTFSVTFPRADKQVVVQPAA